MTPVHRHAHGLSPHDLPASGHGEADHGGAHAAHHAIVRPGTSGPARTQRAVADGAGLTPALSAFRMSVWVRLMTVAAALTVLWITVFLAMR